MPSWPDDGNSTSRNGVCDTKRSSAVSQCLNRRFATFDSLGDRGAHTPLVDECGESQSPGRLSSIPRVVPHAREHHRRNGASVSECISHSALDAARPVPPQRRKTAANSEMPQHSRRTREGVRHLRVRVCRHRTRRSSPRAWWTSASQASKPFRAACSRSSHRSRASPSPWERQD